MRSHFPFRYYNAGVTLMNLDKFRETGIYKKMIDMANSRELTAMEQDAINVFCNGEIVTVGPEWNSSHVTQYAAQPKIRHFAGASREEGRPLFDRWARTEWRVKE